MLLIMSMFPNHGQTSKALRRLSPKCEDVAGSSAQMYAAFIG